MIRDSIDLDIHVQIPSSCLRRVAVFLVKTYTGITALHRYLRTGPPGHSASDESAPGQQTTHRITTE